METIRRFKKMSLWDFIDLMKESCFDSQNKELYFTYLGELRMRKIESVSEGGNYKLSSLAKELKAEFQKELNSNTDFVSNQELEEFNFIVDEITC